LLTNVMVVHPDVPAKTVAEFIAHAKANPGKINMASSGSGTSVHMSGELFKVMTGITMQHVPYRGTAAAMQDLLSNRVQVMFDNLPGSVEHIKAGALRALGVTAGKRAAAIPDVPTIGKTVPGYEAVVWYGIVAPKGTPPEIVDTLNKAVNAVLADPKLEARLVQLGGVAMPMTPAQSGKLIAEEPEKGAKVVKFSGAKPDGPAKAPRRYSRSANSAPAGAISRLSAPHHGALQPGDREIHHGRDNREDGDRGHDDVHFEDLTTVLDEIAETEIRRLELAHDDTDQREAGVHLQCGDQSGHAARQHHL